MILGKLCQETMRLESFIRIIQTITVRGPLTFDIEGVAYDSRQVRKNYLFVALGGEHTQTATNSFMTRCAAARLRLSRKKTAGRGGTSRTFASRTRVARSQKISCAFYNQPSSRIELFGVTGTNGKTTTTFMLRKFSAMPADSQVLSEPSATKWATA